MGIRIYGLIGAWLVTNSLFAAPAELGTTAVRLQQLPQIVRLDGVVEATRQATVSAQTSGRIEELRFDIDDQVTAGDIIVRFRAREQESRYQAARAALKEAQARFAEASAEHRRTVDIFSRKLVAKSVLDQAKANLDAAKARLDGAEAVLAAVEERLGHTLVRAPYSGVVVERHVEVGENATIGSPLMTGLSLEDLRVVVQVPQRFLPFLRGEHASAMIVTDSGHEIVAQQIRISPRINPRSHSATVRLQLPPKSAGLLPGQWVKIALTTGMMERLLVPESSIVRRSEVTALYIVVDGAISLRQVRLGRTHSAGVEVLTGLATGEMVATDPVAAAVALKRAAQP